MKKKNTIWRFLSFFAGATPKYENQITGSDRTKIGLMGITPFIPTGIAYFAGGYAVSTFYMDMPVFVWGFAAPMIALLVLALELVIAASISPGIPSWKKFIFASPRILLSLLLSFTLATPLKLAIFSSPIKQEMQLQRDTWISNKAIKKSAELEKAETDYNQLLSRSEYLGKECKRLQLLYFNEIDGNGGTKRPGIGKIGLAKQAPYLECTKSLDNEKANAHKALLAVQELHEIQKIINTAAITTYNEEYTEDLVTQFEAIARAAKKSSSLKFFMLTILLLLMSLDLTPTMSKLFTSVPSYVIAERIDLQNTQAEQEAMSQAFIQISQERARTLIDIEKRKGDSKRLKNRLAARVHTLDIALAYRQKLEARSIIHEASDPLDLAPFQQTVSDINAFDEVSQALRKTGTGPSNPPHNDPTNPNTPTPSMQSDSQPPPQKPFVLKRIV